MDPLSALSLSCNVLDLVAAAGKTCAFLYDVHKAGAFPAHQELVSTTTLLENSAQTLTQRLLDPQSPRHPRRANDKELLDIAEKARKLASDLQKKLEALQLLPVDSRAKRFEKLLKTALQKGKIYDLQRRWAELRKAVDSALLMRLTWVSLPSYEDMSYGSTPLAAAARWKDESIIESENNAAKTNDQLSDLAEQIRQGLSRLNAVDQEMKKQNDMTRVAVATEAQLTRDHMSAQAETNRQHTSQEAATSRGVSKSEADKTRQHVTAESAASRKTLSQEIQGTKLFVVDDITRRIHTAHKKAQSHLDKKLAFQQRQDSDERKTSSFIDSFRFSGLNERRNQIIEPHSETYEWIFEDNLRSHWDSFSDWSTLMHFICEHKRTQDLLNQWSSPLETKIVSWYFWNSGSPIQRSLKGALCALIYQLLSTQPDIVKILLRGDTYFGHPVSPADWSQTQLVGLPQKIFSLIPGYVAIFLDGLDEFDREEDILVMLNLLRSLTDKHKVKVCLSSRPELRMKLQLSHLPQLRLQDMTADDINQYVDDTLRQIFPNWEDHHLEGFGREVAEKADGVFLWVHVVLKSLQQGFSHSDDYTVLRERLELLPAKMELLYEHMWLSLNGDGDLPTYRKQAALFFSFHDHFPLEILDFVLAVDEDACAMASSTTRAGTILDTLYEKSTHMQTLLQTRCAGLLEIVSNQAGKYLHDEEDSDDAELSDMEGLSDDEEDLDDGKEPLHEELSRTEPATELSIALKNLGRVQFFHRTAKDFLLDKPAGREILESYQLSKQEVVERLLKARLATRICGIKHPSGREHTEDPDFEYNAIGSAIQLIGSLDKNDMDEQVADAQCELLKLVESTYEKKLVPMWDGFLDQSCKRNWFLKVCHRPESPDFWGEVMFKVQSSALTKSILRTGIQDKKFAAYLLGELIECHHPGIFEEAYFRCVQHLLNAGANLNATDIFHAGRSPQSSLWVRFLISMTRVSPRRSEDSSIGTQTLLFETIKCFLHNGADPWKQAMACRQRHLSGQIVHMSEFDKEYHLRPSSVISIVNGVYMLHQLKRILPQPYRENPMEAFAGFEKLMPSCQNLAVVGRDCRIYRLGRSDPDPLELPPVRDASGEVQRLDDQCPQLFSKDREVQLLTVLQEQPSAATLRIPFEEGNTWAKDLAWSWRHLRAREALLGLDHFALVQESLQNIQSCILQLSMFHDEFGLLTESSLPREELAEVEESRWPAICSAYDSYLHEVHQENPKFPLKEFDGEFLDLAGLLNVHGFKKLGFQGKHIALDEEGGRIPRCSEDPAVCDSSHTDEYGRRFWE
ncbi:hypothetical protein H2200_013060 [Cladophialophora chaetospira]|uniref:NACHT domain-containing protein n=1 Tax=Cladophialophora chaetospira TaxID=386627 RepID=A0AA38WWQ4_9EURO|nr:hypothetical protein H2200_013060 [Cladophialophora chaetospira]